MADGNCDQGLLFRNNVFFRMLKFMMMAQFSFREHLASMGPKIKGGEIYGVLGNCIKATGMI